MDMTARQPITARRFLVWVGAGVVGLFLSVLIHEIGHLIAGNIFYRDQISGFQIFPDVSQDAVTDWQQAGTIAAGPLMTSALTIGLYFLQRERINPLTYMIGFTASIRAFAGIDGILDLMGGVPIEDATSDEVAVAGLLGLSPYVTVGLSLTVLFVMWFLYLRLIARRQGGRMLGVVLAGMVTAAVAIFLFAAVLQTLAGITL